MPLSTHYDGLFPLVRRFNAARICTIGRIEPRQGSGVAAAKQSKKGKSIPATTPDPIRLDYQMTLKGLKINPNQLTKLHGRLDLQH